MYYDILILMEYIVVAIQMEIIGYVKTEWILKFGMIKKTYSSTETQLNYRCNLIEGITSMDSISRFS